MKVKMKTLKILSAILLMSAIWSCGTRSVDKNKYVQKSEENTEQNSEVKKESENKETAVISTENNSTSVINAQVKIAEIDRQNELQTKAKTDSETSETKYLFSEYFENGNLKSKTEYSANQSKLLQENSELKKEYDYYRSSTVALQEENKSLLKANSNLVKESKLKSDSIGSFKNQVENYSLQKSNKTDRKFVSLWWFWLSSGIIIGKFGWDILKFFWQKIVASQWYLKLIKK